MTSRLPIVLIVLTVVLDAMGIGLMLPVMPDLIRDLQGGTVSAAAVWGGVVGFTYALTQFLFGPALGALSDALGRRPVLLVSLVGMGLSYLAMAAAPTLWFLVIARGVAGISGATFSTGAAYLADITPPERRAANFGLVGAGFGVGFVLGPAIGGVLGELGPRAPLLAAAALALLNATLVLFRLPESHPPARRRRFSLAAANPFSALVRVSALPMMGGLVGVFFLNAVASTVYPAVWSYFGMERFGWSVGMVGLSLAAYGLSAAVVQGGVIRLVLARLGEVRTVLLGLALTLVSFAFLTVADQAVWVFVMMPVFALGAMVGPALQGMMSNRVADDAQGELQGVLAGLSGLSMIVGPPVMALVFRAFTRAEAPLYAPGAPFAAAGLLAVAALVLFLRALRVRGVPEPERSAHGRT